MKSPWDGLRGSGRALTLSIGAVALTLAGCGSESSTSSDSSGSSGSSAGDSSQEAPDGLVDYKASCPKLESKGLEYYADIEGVPGADPPVTHQCSYKVASGDAISVYGYSVSVSELRDMIVGPGLEDGATNTDAPDLGTGGFEIRSTGGDCFVGAPVTSQNSLVSQYQTLDSTPIDDACAGAREVLEAVK